MFKNFRDAIEAQYNKLQATGKLYTVQIDKDALKAKPINYKE